MSSSSSSSRQAELEEFRRDREESLAAEHGVLAQVGLHWIAPGTEAQRLDGIPGIWQLDAEGRLVVTWQGEQLELLAEEDEVSLEAADGDAADEHRAVVTAEGDVRLAGFGRGVQLDLIRRGGRIGLRVLDPGSLRRAAFTGVPTYPDDPRFVVSGIWREDPQEVTVGSALPWLEQHLHSPGVATLQIEGTEVELRLTGTSNILFTDETSGTESSDWRVVTAELDGEEVHVDFHRAVNFPASFSAWATCPKPPEGNHIPLEIRAGEMRVEPTAR